MKTTFFFAFCFLLFVDILPLQSILFAQEKTPTTTIDAAATTAKRGDFLTIKIAVIGPGDALYFWWGHLALIVEDKLTGESLFYDYGVFSFNKDNFFSNFAFGRLIYTSDVSPTMYDIDYYKKDNRDIILYTLDLSGEQKEEIQKMAIFYSMPENREYLYNHFSNNCVTRILDFIDESLGGQFYEYANGTSGRLTLRQHVRRHTYFSPFFDWFLNFLMGQDIDKPSTVKQEIFLPQEAANQLNNFYYIDSQGNQKKLISNVELINKAKDRPPVLDYPLNQWKYELVFGIILAAILFFLRFYFAKGKHSAKIIFGLSNSFLGLFFGIAGSLVFFMTFFTNHDYTFHNTNVIFINPILLAVCPLALITAFSKNKKKADSAYKALKIVWTYIFASGILTILLKVLPFFYQQNYVSLAMILPIAFALSVLPDVLNSKIRPAAAMRS